MDYLYYLFATLLFIAVVLAIEGAYLGWSSAKGPEAEHIARRLRIMSAGTHSGQQDISIVKERLLSKSPRTQKFLLRLPRIGALDRLLYQSGVSWSAADFLGISLIVFVVVFLAGSLIALPSAISFSAAAAVSIFPAMYVTRARRQRISRMEHQLPDALDLMGRAMKAGHAFPTALKMVGDEMSDPLAGEFRTVFDEVNFGIAMPDALMNLATRVSSTDIRYFVIAVLIQRETGGNLAELLSGISAIIRDRIKLIGQIRVLSAEGKMSAWILSLLPFAAAFMIHLVNPEFLQVLYTDPAGIKMLATALLMMLVGFFVMRSVIRIRV